MGGHGDEKTPRSCRSMDPRGDRIIEVVAADAAPCAVPSGAGDGVYAHDVFAAYAAHAQRLRRECWRKKKGSSGNHHVIFYCKKMQKKLSKFLFSAITCMIFPM